MSSATKKQKHQPERARRMKRRFALLKQLRLDTTLPSSAKMVIWSLADDFYNLDTEQCNPSITKLAKAVGRRRSSVITAAAIAEVEGWINVSSIKGGSKTSTNRYTFNWVKVANSAISEKPFAKTDQRVDVAKETFEEPKATPSADLHYDDGQGTEIIEERNVEGSGSPHRCGEMSKGSGTPDTNLLRTHRSYGAGGEIEDSIAHRAPGGALALEEDLAAKFQQLCVLWQKRSWDDVDLPKARKAFALVCEQHGADVADRVLASAEKYIAATEPKFIKKLEDWFGKGTWKKDSPSKNGSGTGVIEADESLEFENFVKMADKAVWLDGKLREAMESNARNAQQTLDDFEKAGGMAFVEECQLQFKKFNGRDDDYEDNRITAACVGRKMDELIDSFPGFVRKKNAPAFRRQLVSAVLAAGPNVVQLDSACRELVRTGSDFPPGVSKVVAAIDEQDALWTMYIEAIHGCGWAADRLKKKLAEDAQRVAAEKVKEVERRLAAEEAKRVEEERRATEAELRAQPLAVGDRVIGLRNFSSIGPGTITRDGGTLENPGFDIAFDSATRLYLDAKRLARLIPGDAGFEITEAKRAEITQKLAEYDRRIAGRKAAYEHRRAEQVLESDDRVWNEHWGYGTVMDVSDCPDSYSVRFDSGYVRSVYRDYLELRLAGLDDWGEAPPNVSMDFPVDPCDDEEDDPPRSYFGGALPPLAETSKPEKY
jgi:hypothetical protein